ncbi:hypothetical protein PR048_012541 [Dryococelus australis]|uniref:Uncharacterized protein n=1 Tax=Dryococelus australis TaxID=614101 RepID=A0ABQ9HQA4_9NEOP|nr:hypothetical protein PR048_012541 [Dryococelus australis]
MRRVRLILGKSLLSPDKQSSDGRISGCAPERVDAFTHLSKQHRLCDVGGRATFDWLECQPRTVVSKHARITANMRRSMATGELRTVTWSISTQTLCRLLPLGGSRTSLASDWLMRNVPYWLGCFLWSDYSPLTKANRVRFPTGLLLDFHLWELHWTMQLVGRFFRGTAGSHIPAFQRRSILNSFHPLEYLHSVIQIGGRITTEQKTAPERKSGGNGRTLRKPAGQWHSPARFLSTQVIERRGRCAMMGESVAGIGTCSCVVCEVGQSGRESGRCRAAQPGDGSCVLFFKRQATSERQMRGLGQRRVKCTSGRSSRVGENRGWRVDCCKLCDVETLSTSTRVAWYETPCHAPVFSVLLHIYCVRGGHINPHTPHKLPQITQITKLSGLCIIVRGRTCALSPPRGGRLPQLQLQTHSRHRVYHTSHKHTLQPPPRTVFTLYSADKLLCNLSMAGILFQEWVRPQQPPVSADPSCCGDFNTKSKLRTVDASSSRTPAIIRRTDHGCGDGAVGWRVALEGPSQRDVLPSWLDPRPSVPTPPRLTSRPSGNYQAR